MAKRRSGTRPITGAHALAQRVSELTGPELINFMREAFGTENGDPAAALRYELREAAREVFVEWAQVQMRLACGLMARVNTDDPSEDDE